ncbi:uncharacterized protein LOC127075192 [Lathyrus oleraceus]|uniref:DUF7815 domain-containing protein n=1 Tax=Pisum sativum TaxID=3888 RepID=A0A9D4XJ52_PEA|nr:uncharacterized protein LOC127075192 [Pisum sativum]KAI5419860.1 hypothetical protein KIW84_043858 [Pisum sativum]
MAFEIPVDQIKHLQILLRKEANLSWYHPEKEENLPLPKLASVAETVAKLDPSPPYLRCKNCNGRLLRGVQSFICVFCGSNPHKDLPPDPIKFKNTLGYRWLLESLQLDGSEMVEPIVDEHASNRARSELNNEIPLSELLDLEIQWNSEAERTLSSNSDSEAFPGESSLSLSGVDVDSFFDRRESDSNVSELNSASERNVGAASDNTFQANENLSLFQNVQASEALGGSVEDQSGYSFSGWEANFKSASSGPVHEESKSVDHSKVELDTISGYQNDSVGVTKNDDFNPSASEDDWFQGDGFRTSNSMIAGQSGKLEKTGDLHTEKEEIVNASSTRNLDWMQDDQWQESDTKIPDIGATDEDDSWNDFTGSASTQDPYGIISTSTITAQTGNFEFPAVNLTNTKPEEGANSSSNKEFDWMGDNQWQDNDNKATDNVGTKEATVLFDSWNDFTGSAAAEYSPPSVSNAEITYQTGKFEKTEDPNDTKTAESAVGSSSNFDWMQNNQWQGNNNKATGITTTNDITNSFDAWNDFTGSAISQNPSSSALHSEIKDQTGISELTADLHDTNTVKGDSASNVKSFDWMQDDQWQVSNNKTTDTVTTKNDADSFDVWSDFTNMTTRQEDPLKNVPLQTLNQTNSEKTFEMNLFGSSNNSHDMDFSGFSQHGFLGQHGTPAATNAQRTADSLNRVADEDTVRQNPGDVSTADLGSKDDVEMLMSQMHDLSFMLESNLSFPSK